MHYDVWLCNVKKSVNKKSPYQGNNGVTQLFRLRGAWLYHYLAVETSCSHYIFTLCTPTSPLIYIYIP